MTGEKIFFTWFVFIAVGFAGGYLRNGTDGRGQLPLYRRQPLRGHAERCFYWQNRDAIAAHDKNTTVIYALGVNDLDASRCLKALQDLSNLGFKRIYFVATTPIDEAKAHARGYTVTNAQIMKFNADVAAALPPRVYDIDAYAYLLEKGIESNDGLHYQAPTYRQWYTYMMNYIR